MNTHGASLSLSIIRQNIQQLHQQWRIFTATGHASGSCFRIYAIEQPVFVYPSGALYLPSNLLLAEFSIWIASTPSLDQ
jgi:hypothetical protein